MRTKAAPGREAPLKTILCAVIAAVFLLSLIPPLLLARDARPYADDLLYAQETARVFADTGSVARTLRAAARTVAAAYTAWQGTYSAIFLMALHPGVWGEGYYALTPVLLLLALIGGTLFLAHVLLRVLLGAGRRDVLTVGLTMLFFSVQLPPSAMEGFFWFNGGVYYTFFHSLFLVLAGVTLLACERPGRGAWALRALAVLLAAVIAGGNYATLLPCGVLTFFCALWQGARGRRGNCAFCAALLAVLLAGFAVSALAPGNAVRQAAVSQQYASCGPAQAIALSFVLAAAAVVNRFDTGAALLIVLVCCLTAPLLRKTPWRFAHPALALALSFCVFAAQFTPTLYVAASPGPLRLRNVVFFNFYWLLAFDSAYLCGYALRRLEAAKLDGQRAALRGAARKWLCARPLAVLLAAALLTGAAVLQRDLPRTTTAAAVVALYTGGAAERQVLLPGADGS